MIKIKKYIIEEKELDLEYDEEFELYNSIYKITEQHEVYYKLVDNNWGLSEVDVNWVYENKDKIIKH